MTRYNETIAEAFRQLSPCCKYEYPNKPIRYRYEYIGPDELVLIKITDKATVPDEQNTKLNERYHGPVKIGEIDREICKPTDPSSPLTEESFQQYVDQLGGKHPIKPYCPIISIHLYSMIKSEG